MGLGDGLVKKPKLSHKIISPKLKIPEETMALNNPRSGKIALEIGNFQLENQWLHVFLTKKSDCIRLIFNCGSNH